MGAHSTSRSKAKGFTLLEVMVVIGIIGVMAVMIVPTTVGQLENSKVKKTHSDLKSMKAALDIYAAEMGRGKYPASGNDVAVAMENQGITWDNCKDGWEREYEYYLDAGGLKYYLVSAGSNGQLGGTVNDDIYVSEKQNPMLGTFAAGAYVKK